MEKKSEVFNYYLFKCTLKDTLIGKYNGVSSRTPYARPEYLILYPSVRDEEHYRPFQDLHAREIKKTSEQI